jgi:transposase InsO family protein
MITTELQSETTKRRARQTQVLRLVGVAPSSWHRAPRTEERQRPGPPRRVIAEEVVKAVVAMATENPWYGYKRIAVMCRRAGQSVKDREAYAVMKEQRLLQKRKTRRAEIHQTAKLFELLPQGPNDLWQMDVTYIHIPGYGWWYAVTVIDYYSRYLLACHLTSSYSATETAYALKLARAEAERIHGPLTKRPFLVTDNGSSFIAKRFLAFVADQYSHVRIQYRTPQQLGLLERFHQTLKTEEVYWSA